MVPILLAGIYLTINWVNTREQIGCHAPSSSPCASAMRWGIYSTSPWEPLVRHHNQIIILPHSQIKLLMVGNSSALQLHKLHYSGLKTKDKTINCILRISNIPMNTSYNGEKCLTCRFTSNSICHVHRQL